MIVTSDVLSLDEVINEVAGKEYGAVVTFSGCVRDTENDAPITAIVYEAYAEMAGKEFQKIVSDLETRFRVRIALRHRIGKVAAGEASLVVACAGVHRKEAYAACELIIDEIKEKVPVWKVEFEKN